MHYICVVNNTNIMSLAQQSLTKYSFTNHKVEDVLRDFTIDVEDHETCDLYDQYQFIGRFTFEYEDRKAAALSMGFLSDVEDLQQSPSGIRRQRRYGVSLIDQAFDELDRDALMQIFAHLLIKNKGCRTE